MIVRGLSPTTTTILFLLMWAAMFVFMRYVAPKATKDGIKLVAISFAAATAGLIVTAIAFALIAAFN